MTIMQPKWSSSIAALKKIREELERIKESDMHVSWKDNAFDNLQHEVGGLNLKLIDFLAEIDKAKMDLRDDRLDEIEKKFTDLEEDLDLLKDNFDETEHNGPSLKLVKKERTQ
jgi:predicted  nucleic acid-binding Zn-ribbon protein